MQFIAEHLSIPQGALEARAFTHTLLDCQLNIMTAVSNTNSSLSPLASEAVKLFRSVEAAFIEQENSEGEKQNLETQNVKIVHGTRLLYNLRRTQSPRARL